jgi:hypothetical protein
MGTRISKEGEPEAINWWPMLFSAAIVSFPLGLARRGMARPLDWTLTGFRLAQHPGVSALEWSLATLAVFVFVGLFAFAVVSWQRQRTFLWVVPLLTLLGIAFAPAQLYCLDVHRCGRRSRALVCWRKHRPNGDSRLARDRR